jgi:hypothetical protein
MGTRWIEFDERQRRRSEGYFITLNGAGEFLMNRSLFEGMGQPAAVTLYFDPGSSLIGLRKADPNLPNAFAVRERGKCGGRLIRASTFARKWNIRLNGTFSFPEPKFDDDILVLPLKGRFNVSRRRNRST